MADKIVDYTFEFNADGSKAQKEYSWKVLKKNGRDFSNIFNNDKKIVVNRGDPTIVVTLKDFQTLEVRRNAGDDKQQVTASLTQNKNEVV